MHHDSCSIEDAGIIIIFRDARHFLGPKEQELLAAAAEAIACSKTPVASKGS
jgi:hypothetical protein